MLAERVGFDARVAGAPCTGLHRQTASLRPTSWAFNDALGPANELVLICRIPPTEVELGAEEKPEAENSY
jgi:hypothetical protein